MPSAPHAPTRETQTTTGTATLVALALLQTVLFLVPMIVLGRAIGWPASLRLPPAELLPLIAREALAVQIGYWAYLLVSLALLPLALAMRRFLQDRGVAGVLADTAAVMGIAAGLLKMLGIVRWLSAMPALAVHYSSATDAATRTAIEMAYVALNGYAGAVGELLGVQLVSGVWLLLTGRCLIRARMPWTGGTAIVIGALFVATCLRTFAPELAALQSVAVPLALAWFPVLAVAAWRSGRRCAPARTEASLPA